MPEMKKYKDRQALAPSEASRPRAASTLKRAAPEGGLCRRVWKRLVYGEKALLLVAHLACHSFASWAVSSTVLSPKTSSWRLSRFLLTCMYGQRYYDDMTRTVSMSFRQPSTSRKELNDSSVLHEEMHTYALVALHAVWLCSRVSLPAVSRTEVVACLLRTCTSPAYTLHFGRAPKSGKAGWLLTESC